MSGLRVEDRRGLSAFRDLEKDWRSLRACPPFLSFDWAESWHRHLGAGRTPRIVSAWDGQRLVAVLPLCEERRPLPGLGRSITRLSFAGERVGGADYLDVLADGPGRELATARIFQHLAAARDFDLLDLDGMDEASSTHHAIRASFDPGLGFKQRRWPRYICPQIELDGGFEEVLARSSRAQNFRRRLRQLRAEPGFEHRSVRSVFEAAEAFERFLHLHDLRWKRQGGSDGLGRRAARDFHRELVLRLARAGRLHFDELWVGGQCVASIYGIDDAATDDTFYFFQSGYDPALARKSVGLVLLGLSIEGAIARGARVYDFLHGTEPYKLEWAGGKRRTVAVRVVSLGLGASLLLLREAGEAIARRGAHALLPQITIEALRRRRRVRENDAES